MEKDIAHMHDEFLIAYETHADAIFRHCYFRVFNRERARELAQEAFMKTWEYLSQGREIRNIRAFLYRVANNLVIDESRKKKERSLDEMGEYGYDPVSPRAHETPLHTADGRLATDALKKLDAKYRDVIVLRYINDLTPKEIAEILEENENTVSVRIHRGLEQLRTLFV